MALGEFGDVDGTTVVELGAAPGGGTWAWFEMEMHVVAIDPGEMAEAYRPFAEQRGLRYEHVRCPASELGGERLVAKLGVAERWLLANLEINDERVELAQSSVLGRFAEMGTRIGLTDLRVLQLPSHRREVKAVLRRSKKATPRTAR